MFEIAGQQYRVLRGSDLDRDGMYLEVSDADSKPLLEIFYSDVTHRMTVATLSNNVPLDVVEWSIMQAKALLPPTKND